MLRLDGAKRYRLALAAGAVGALVALFVGALPAYLPAAGPASAPAPARRDGATSPAEDVAAAREERLSAQTLFAASQRPKPPPIAVHRVEPGDTLWSIAERYGSDVDSILANNDVDRQRPIAVGVELRVPRQPGRIHTVQEGDTLEAIALTYNVTVESIAEANGIDRDGLLLPGQELLVPGARAGSPRVQVAAVSRDASAGARYIWPAQGPVTSGYGYRWGRPHRGIDIGAGQGAPVAASRRGVVLSAGWRGPYGIAVELDHGGGVTTLYAHLSQAIVEPGEAVAQGQTIGRVGSTGESTGPHVHFEIRRGGSPIDPTPLLP